MKEGHEECEGCEGRKEEGRALRKEGRALRKEGRKEGR
jgi:hypothetical protein